MKLRNAILSAIATRWLTPEEILCLLCVDVEKLGFEISQERNNVIPANGHFYFYISDNVSHLKNDGIDWLKYVVCCSSCAFLCY